MQIKYSADVTQARKNGAPIVALESTIITHGMPFPQNLSMARDVEKLVTEHGATPATIAVLDGNLHVGLTEGELEHLANFKNAAKLSRADLGFAIASGQTGATTVSATMIAARQAGIHTFATGGIGGVHRGAEHSFDISADLQELAQTPVNVVCAGAKAILDISKTLEVLETLGVPVIAFGQDEFPAFWSRISGHPAPLRADTADLIAHAFAARRKLQLPGGQLIANPVPKTAEIAQQDIEPIIQTAIAEAEEKQIQGKKVTPYLLGRIFELTAGKSLDCNIALVRNNAELAAKISVAISDHLP